MRICLPRQRNRFDPWFGKIAHVLEQLSPCTTTIETCSTMKSNPCSLTAKREIVGSNHEDPGQPKNKKTQSMSLSRLPVLLLSALFLKRLPTVCIHTHQVFLLPWEKYCYCLFAPVIYNFLWPNGLKPTRLLCPSNFPGKNTGMGCHFLLQGIFRIQGSNLLLLHWWADSLPVSHQGSPYKSIPVLK